MILNFQNLRESTQAEKEKFWLATWAKDRKSIDIRRTIRGGSSHFAQILITVYKKPNIVPWDSGKAKLKEFYAGHSDIIISMNGKCDMDFETYYTMGEAILEAKTILNND